MCVCGVFFECTICGDGFFSQLSQKEYHRCCGGSPRNRRPKSPSGPWLAVPRLQRLGSEYCGWTRNPLRTVQKPWRLILTVNTNKLWLQPMVTKVVRNGFRNHPQYDSIQEPATQQPITPNRVYSPKPVLLEVNPSSFSYKPFNRP